MSEAKQQVVLAPALASVLAVEERFIEINKIVGSVNWASEQMFAMQALKKNDFIWDTANKNPESVRNAIVNIAAIGLSLNPATKYAYLVPRDNAIMLDISYQGLIKLATDTGAVRWAKADMVYANDTYEYRGVGEKPLHVVGGGSNSFLGERGEIVGGYCIAKTSDGDYLTEQMTIEQINAIRDASKAWQSYQSGKAKQCPWATYPEEMQKKTIIKRASKTWVKSERSERFQEAIRVINEHEGIDFDDDKPPAIDIVPVATINEDQLLTVIAILEEKGIDKSRLMGYYKIESLAELPACKYDEAVSFLEKAK